METAVQQNDLQALAGLLQENLNSELVTDVPIQVKCVFQHDTLMVLAQEANLNIAHSQSIFNTLQDSIEALQLSFPESVWQKAQQVRLFLRVAGERQPFATHEFALPKQHESPDSDKQNSEGSFLLDSFANVFKWEDSADENQPSQPKDAVNLAEIKEETANQVIAESTSPAEQPEEPITESKSVKEAVLSPEKPTPKAESSKLKLPSASSIIRVGAGVAIVGTLGAFYVLTRPCVLGECTTIKTAQKLNQEAAKTLKNAKAEGDIQKGKEYLTDATDKLAAIPFWSKYHPEAQKLLNNYKQQTAKIDPLLKALDKAELAAQKSQDPPHTVQEWQDIQVNWRQAIAALNQVPKNSPAYSLAQQRLKIYQINLNAISQRIKQEQEAETKLAAAQETANLAQVRQNAAKTLNHWQQAASTWEATINTLAAIPPNTMAYSEAQQLQNKYLPNLGTARARVSQEQVSANIYNQAIAIANLAKNHERNNQWTQAVISWRRAATYTDQIPSGTFYYAQAQQLNENYNISLRQAQAKLQVALVVQKAQSDLSRICAGVPKICDYIVTGQGIKVYLTPAYINGVRRTAMTAGLSGDAKTLASVDDHLKTLQAALEAISENAGITLEIYDQNRSQIGRYVPKQG